MLRLRSHHLDEGLAHGAGAACDRDVNHDVSFLLAASDQTVNSV